MEFISVQSLSAWLITVFRTAAKQTKYDDDDDDDMTWYLQL